MQGKRGDGQHDERGGRGKTRDERVADNVRRATRGDPAADNTTRGQGWRTCNKAMGGGNNERELEAPPHD